MGDSAHTIGPAARRYARALFLAARDAGSLTEVGADMDLLREVSSCAEIRQWFSDPRVDDQRRRTLIRKELGERCHPLTRGLLAVLARRRRQALLPALPDAFRDLLDVHQGRLRGLLESAFPVDDGQRTAIQRAFSRHTGKEVLLETRVLPQLLGGIRVTLGGVRYDGTARARLDSLRARLDHAEIGTR